MNLHMLMKGLLNQGSNARTSIPNIFYLKKNWTEKKIVLFPIITPDSKDPSWAYAGRLIIAIDSGSFIVVFCSRRLVF